MSNTFSKLCKCKFCGKNMKYKNERDIGKYICSTYDNYGKNYCKRTHVSEDFLKSLIFRRFQRELSDQEIREIVDYVEVEDSLLLEIHFKNGDEPILLKGKFIQF